MSGKFKVWCALVSMCLVSVGFGGVRANAQNMPPSPDTPASQPGPNLPDACKLLPQADIEALFPGRPVTSKGPTLSPLYKGPQYAESCMYLVKVPSPTSKLEIAKFATITIVQWGGETDGPHGSASTFATIRSTREKVVSNPTLNLHIEQVPNLGDEALMETSSSTVTVRVRKADLIYVVSLDIYSPQSQPNVLALATQVAKRWKAGTGMVEAATPIAATGSVDIPEDTRTSSVAPADQWPDACALLTPDDVHAIFSDMKIAPPQKTMGKITHMSRLDRTEELPKPIRCFYQTSRTDLINGERRFVTNDVTLIVENVAATPELSKTYYEAARKVGDAKTEIDGLGDEACINIMNEIHIRKGLLTIEVRVGGGDRDRTLHDDATRRVNEVAKLVSKRLP
jgi:hypothetical protein